MEKDMTGRIKRAEDQALEKLESILQAIPTPDFVEIVGRINGDIISYQIYDDGSIYERSIFYKNMDYSERNLLSFSRVRAEMPYFLCLKNVRK